MYCCVFYFTFYELNTTVYLNWGGTVLPDLFLECITHSSLFPLETVYLNGMLINIFIFLQVLNHKKFKESISIFECQAYGGILIKYVVAKLNRKCCSHSFAFPSAEFFLPFVLHIFIPKAWHGALHGECSILCRIYI